MGYFRHRHRTLPLPHRNRRGNPPCMHLRSKKEKHPLTINKDLYFAVARAESSLVLAGNPPGWQHRPPIMKKRSAIGHGGGSRGNRADPACVTGSACATAASEAFSARMGVGRCLAVLARFEWMRPMSLIAIQRPRQGLRNGLNANAGVVVCETPRAGAFHVEAETSSCMPDAICGENERFFSCGLRSAVRGD